MATISPIPHRRKTSEYGLISAASWCVLMGGLGVTGAGHGLAQAQAQSVFRCGSSYSNETHCEHGTAAGVPLQGDTPHASKAPPGMAQQMQSEAGRLEKIRQRETREKKSSNDLPGQHKTKKRKKSTTASPYFTAKGAADSKKP